MRAKSDRQAVNSMVQGSAADVLKQAMIKVANAISGTHALLVSQIHDELVLEVPLAEQERYVVMLQDCMENAMKLDVPLRSIAFHCVPLRSIACHCVPLRWGTLLPYTQPNSNANNTNAMQVPVDEDTQFDDFFDSDADAE